jgi:hypothetical protein
MVTIKSYTDLEQSKKLAEILPLESADMYFEPSAGFCTEPSEVRVGDIKYAHPRSIRCWSLAALLNIIPKHIKEYNTLRIDIGEKDFSIWYDEVGCGVNTELPDITMEEPVDACVEMIVKLKEMNLL